MGSQGPRFRSVFHRTESSQVSGAGYLYGQAKQLIRAGDLKEALWHLNQAVQVKPDFAAAWSALGVVLAQTGDDAGARAAFDRAIELTPSDEITWRRLSDFEQTRGHTEAANYAAQQATRSRGKRVRQLVLGSCLSFLCLTVGGTLYVTAGQEKERQQATLESLPTTTGTVTELRLFSRWSAMEYRYLVLGKKYGGRLSLGNYALSSKYREGDPITVHYNPENPNIAHVHGESADVPEPGYGGLGGALSIFGTLLALMCGWSVIKLCSGE